jgi:hypothetical protein
MSNKLKSLFIAMVLILILISLTSCSQTCSTPLCNNDAQMFRDLCETCKSIADRANSVIDGIRNLIP